MCVLLTPLRWGQSSSFSLRTEIKAERGLHHNGWSQNQWIPLIRTQIKNTTPANAKRIPISQRRGASTLPAVLTISLIASTPGAIRPEGSGAYTQPHLSQAGGWPEKGRIALQLPQDKFTGMGALT